MSEADTDSTDEHLTGESTFFAQIDPKSEHFMKMDTNDDSSSSQDPPKELSSTSSDPFLLKDPEKDLKDESNKTTDSPKRVKLIRPEFDKEKLAQKIREIEEREKLKQLNKLKEQELSKSEEKTGETSTENKSEEAGKSEDLDTKNYVESEKELKNKETSTSKSTIDKLSKIDVNDAVLHRDESRDSIASTEDSGKKLNEESKVSTSVGDLKEIETVGVKSDTKPTPATSAQVSEEQKQDENVIQKNDVKAKDSVKEKIERDDQVSSNVGELKKETKVGEEETKNGGLERKVVFGKELGDPKKLGTSETDKATSSQNKVEMKPVEVSSTETAIASKDNINQQPKSVGSIDSTKTVAGGVKEVNIGEKDPELVEEDGKSKEKIEKEFDESKSKVQENLGSSIAKSASSVAEVAKTVSNLEKPVKNVENPVDKLKSIESTSVVDVQQTVENVFDELTVEPSKAVDKSKAKPESKQQELTAVSEKMHADELSNKSDDILMEIEKFIDSSGESPKKGPVEKLEANQKIVETSSKSVEKVAPTSSKRKLDDEVSSEDAKKKYTPTNVDSMKSKESTDLDSLEEKNILMGESMEVSESVLDVTDVKNKKETNVDCRSDDDKSSSKDSKDDDETKKGDQPLEKMLDSIIDFEPEPAEVPEEELVISDIPSTALIETKIPESPRRVKLVRPSKPVTKTLTKPEVPQKTLQTKSVEQKISSEIKDVPVKPVEKPQEVQEKVENIRGKEDTTKQDENTKKTEEEVSKNPDYEDAKKIEKEEIITVSPPKPSDKPVELEKKLIVSKEKTVVEKTKAEEMEIGSLVKVIPTVEKETVLKTPIVEKLTTDKPTISSAPIIVETASVEQELKLHEKNVEKVEELLHEQEKIVSKEPEKDISSEKLTLETPVAQKKISERKSEPKSVEKTVLLKSTEPPPPSITVKEDKIETEIIEKSVSEEAVATPKINTSEVATALETSENQSAPSKIASREEAVKETEVTKEPIVKSTEVSKIPQASSPKKNDSTQEKASPGESEVSKLRRIIRKPKLDSSNDNKQAETVTSTSVAHDVEKKQEILSKQSSEVEKDVVLDMTVDEEGEEEGEKAVTSTETKQEKQLGFKLKIAKSSSTIIPKEDKSIPSASILAEKLLSQKSTEHTFGSITISATSSKQQTNIKKVEQMLKDTDVTITPLVGRESVQKLDKITLKIGKDGNPPEIKQTGSTEVKRKQVEKGGGGDDVGSPTRKKMKDESAVLTTSAGVEIDLHLKKSKLLSSLIAEPPMSAQDPRMLMAQQMMAQTSQQIMGLSPQQQSMFQQMMSQGQSSQQMMNPGQMMQQMMMGQASGQQMIQQMLAQGLTPQQIMQQVLGQGQQTSQQMMMGQQMMNQLTPQQANIFLGSPQTSGSSYPGTPGSEVVKKKRGRPRKIPILEGQHPQDQQVAALKQQIMMQSQQGSSGTGTSSGSGGSEEYSSGVFPQVPLFDMTESLFDQPHLFPNQVNAMQGGERGRPQRSCRGRVKLPSVRSRKPRGSTMAVRAGVGRGRGRGRGYKRVEPEFVESDNIITLENVKEEMRRQSMEQSQFLSGNEPMEIQPSQDPTSLAAPGQDSNLMKSPEKKPRKRRTEEQERERIEKMKQKREEKKMKTLEKKRKIAEARAREKAAVMAAALVEEETRMSAPERKEEAERKKEVKTEEEKKVEGETDVSLKEEPSEPEPNSVLEPDEVSQQSLDTKEAVQLEKEVIQTEESQEPSTPISKPDLVDVTSNSCDESVKVEHSSFQDIKKESSTNTDTVERSPSCFVTPRKEKKIYRCLICREESALKKLTSPLDHRSWRVLYQAAIVRGHEEIINLTKNLSDEIPSGILYHRNCRSEFTHKKTLAKLTDTPLPEDGHHHHHHHHHHTPTAAKTTGAENINPNTPKDVRMEGTITEYQWPLQGGELYMIQEQVSDFLEITSFKRKYPDIFRRTVDPEEKAYLRENGLVSEAHCDLGLIAVKSSDILDIMFADFQDKYEEFRKQIRDKQARELSSKHKAAFNCLLLDKRKFDNRVLDAKTEAMQAVAAWNSRLNKTRTEERRCMLDLQSMIVHYPRTVGVKRSQVPNPPDKVGHYPVALVPGQFCDHYKKYNSNELKYFPLNTVIYGPMKPNERFGGGSVGSQTDTDSSTSSDDSSDSSSDSSDDSSGSGDESNDKTLTSAAGAKDRQPSGETHCKMCGGDKTRNKQDNPEVLINCAQCTKSSQLMQLNRLPTVLLSNISSVRSPIKTSSSNSSLSKLLKPTVNSPSPVKRFKTETGFIATDPSKPRVLGTGSTNNVTRVLGTGPTNVARVLGTGSPNVVNVLGTSTTGSSNVVRVLGTETPKSNVTRVLGTGTPVKVLGADSTKPNVVRVLGTQVVKVQGGGGTQFVRTQEVQNIRVQNVQEGQSIRVMGTQIVKPQEVTGAQNIRVMGTQIVKPQDVKMTGTQEAQMGTQIVNPQQEVSGTQIVNVQEPQNIMGPKPVETQSEGVQQTETLKPQVSPLRGIRRFSQISESQQKVKVEIDQAVQSIKTEVDQAVQSIAFDDNQTEQSIKIEESRIVENQSNKVEASQNVEVQSVETQDSLKEIQDVQTQDSLKDVETREISSVKVGDSQNDEVAEEQCILESRRLEAQNIQTQETESVETPGSQNVETEYIKPSPEQIMNSDSNTSNSILQSNTVSSESIVTVDKGDTVSTTVDTEMG